MPANTGALDKVLEISGKLQQIAGILVPGVPLVGLGVAVAKFIAGEVNKARQPGDPELVLPADSQLIQRFADTSTRVVDTGRGFLDG